MIKHVIFCTTFLVAGLPALAGEAAPILIDNVWARESPPTVNNGAAYMQLTNSTDKPERLTGGSTTIAERVELHTHIMEEGMMMMRPVDDIAIEPGQTTTLEPGGLHVMLIGLQTPLVAGQSFELTLQFEQAGERTIEVPVRKMGAGMKPSGGH